MSPGDPAPTPLDEGLRAGAASLEASPSWGGLISLLERCAELAEAGVFGPSERELILGLLADTTWKPAARFELGLAAGPGHGLTLALELLPDLDLTIERARRAQRSLVSWCEDARAAEVWSLLMSRVSWIERRVLLNALEDHRAAWLVPALSTLGADTDPVTRAAVVDAMARIGHVSAQPFLCASLGAGDDAVAARAARALSGLGTRAALEPLLGYASTRNNAEVARAAIAAIEARHPASDLARPGSLSASETSPTTGALSLSSGASAGDIALYERASVAIRDGVDAARALEPAGGNWYALAAAPRSLPLMVYARSVVAYDARTVCGWLALALFLTSWLLGPSTLAGAAAVSSWFACVVFVCAALSRVGVASELEMLRAGAPTFAGVMGRSKTPRKGPKGQDITLHEYELTYMDDRGVTWNTWRRALAPIEDLETNAPLPTLCIGKRSMLRSGIPGVRVRPDGRLEAVGVRAVFAALLPLTSVALAFGVIWRWVGLLVG